MSMDLAQVYTDFSGLDALKAKARKDKDAALDEVSRQFESLFMQMMLKSMRKASLGDGMLDNKNTEFYRDMYDQQIAMDLSKSRGMGLAEVIKRQLGGISIGTPSSRDVQAYREQPTTRVEGSVSEPGPAVKSHPVRPSSAAVLDGSQGKFIEALRPAAEKAAERLGLPAEALLAQAALETGWGKHVMSRSDGSSSHNLFGIKADGRWEGHRVRVSTLEYRDGVAMRTRADFRAYDSFEDSFSDYVRFVQENPRYADALRVTGDVERYFNKLQQAGYATDPAYAEKIGRILETGPLRTATGSVQEGAGAG